MGDTVVVNVSDHQIIVTGPARPTYDLAELVARIPKGYKATEVDFGLPIGKEAWWVPAMSSGGVETLAIDNR